MLKKIRNIFRSFSEEGRREKKLKAMEEFLSQATDRVHLEQLENQWFKKHGWM